MKPLSRVIALLTSVAHLLAACSSGTHNQVQSAPTQPAATTTQSPTGNASATLPKAALDASNLITGWPPDTPGLREVVFNFNVKGNPNNVLTNDESGFLVIQSEQTSQLAKLTFYNGKKAAYMMPAHSFKILSIGPSLICRNLRFTVPENQHEGITFDLEVFGYLDVLATLNFAGPSGNLGVCRPDAEWARWDKSSGTGGEAKGRRAKKGGDDVGKKVALGIAGAIVLLPICILSAGIACGGRVNFNSR